MMRLKKSTATINVSLKAVKGLLRSEMITLDSKLVLESASVPKAYRDDSNEYALDKPLVSKILASAKIRRLRVFLFCLASSGCRVGELASIKWSDLNLNSRPASIHLRPETTKTRTGRTVYISDEAKEELEQWRIFKQDSYAEINKEISDDELVFLTQRRDFTETHPEHIAHRIQISFGELLESLNIGTKKQQQDKSSRHTITPHAFRKFFKTQVSLEAKEPDLAEYLIGHRSLSQTYFRVTPKQIQQIYTDKIMPLLTFCNTAELERIKEEKITEIANKDFVIAATQKHMKDKDIELEELRRKVQEQDSFETHVTKEIDEIKNALKYQREDVAKRSLSAAEAFKDLAKKKPKTMEEFYEAIQKNPATLWKLFQGQVKIAEAALKQQQQAEIELAEIEEQPKQK